MNISADTVVSFYYSLSEQGGAALENNREGLPLAYLHGHRNLLPALEQALEGRAEGETFSVSLSPEQAYGARRENARQKVPVKHLASKHKRLLPGTVVKLNTEQGPVDARVIKPGKFMVEVDLNHPFAGLTLVFDIEISAVRAATAEEIAHGHAHGAGGHHH